MTTTTPEATTSDAAKKAKSNISPRRRRREQVSLWTPFRANNDLEDDWFKESKDKVRQVATRWLAAKTVSDGNCGLDAIAIALNLPRDKTTFSALRRRIAQHIGTNELATVTQKPNPKLEREAKHILKNGTWVSDEQIVQVLCNDEFKVIPILLNGQYDPEQLLEWEAFSEEKKERLIRRAAVKNVRLPHQQSMFLGFEVVIPIIRRLRALNRHLTTYIVLKHVGGAHWVTLAQQLRGDSKIRTIFIEDELPSNLLKEFLYFVSASDIPD